VKIYSILLYGLEEWLIFIRRSVEEPVQSHEVPVQHLNLLDTCQGLHTQDGGYLVRVGFDAPLSDHISQKKFGGHSEGILVRIVLGFILLEAVKCLAQVL